MSRNDPQFNLRIPYELKAKVESSAKHSKRSATAEIIARLERSFADDDHIQETADYMAWSEENPDQVGGESIVAMLAHLRSLISSAESGLKVVERLYDEKTGEHGITADKAGNLIKTYEQ